MNIQAVKHVVRHLVRVDVVIVPRLNDAGDGVLLVGMLQSWPDPDHMNLPL